MFRIVVGWIKYLGNRRSRWLLFPVIWTSLLLLTLSLVENVGRALEPPSPPEENLSHFRKTTDLKDYFEEIQVMIEPSMPCAGAVPLIILVTSEPSQVERRLAIRDSWGQHQHTFFVLGLEGSAFDENMVDVYVEAKQFGDIMVLEMPEHYHNLTLKTMLMLKWTLDRCPHVEHVLKTDDDIFVNPWTLRQLLVEHSGDKVIGFRRNNTRIHRDEYNKWYVPRWLLSDDVITQYVSGNGYIINGKYLRDIIEAAMKTPLINLEDVYLTYLVCKKTLQFELVHDSRLNPYRPWLNVDCAYWSLAVFHRIEPSEVLDMWERVQRIADLYENDKTVCNFYRKYLERNMLFY